MTCSNTLSIHYKMEDTGNAMYIVAITTISIFLILPAADSRDLRVALAFGLVWFSFSGHA